MEQLKLHQEKLLLALATLDEALHLFTQQKVNSPLYRACRDSVIQRFKYCFDLSWKYTKEYLEKIHGVIAPSPRTAFRGAFNTGVISAEDAEILLDAVAARNTTSHIYQESIAEEITRRVPLFFITMKELTNKLKI